MIIVPNSKIGVFICTYDVDYNTGSYKTKALNDKNQEIFRGALPGTPGNIPGRGTQSDKLCVFHVLCLRNLQKRRRIEHGE